MVEDYSYTLTHGFSYLLVTERHVRVMLSRETEFESCG